ncbi:hypothetical protein [Streptomyces sp. NPDC050804]|uniref:hypothetical protein n=1 Tax=unclassified Streptomyces TaxID=2593676 RepID=UPI00341AD252|nr:class I SAM-dependent methyltransferase [Streptomyces sp. NBC_00872]
MALPTIDTDRENPHTLLRSFYTVPRVGQERLSDGGGPFGFDITTALQVDFLIGAYACDGVVETGCFLGDTTDYLSRMYADLPVRTCDIDPRSAGFTRQRLRRRDNVEVYQGDSGDLMPTLLAGLERPLVYLDAHWNTRWPLQDELIAVGTGIVAVDDFNIGHPSFGYDHYDGVDCGPELIAQALPDIDELFVGNPYAGYPLPCLQTGRRSGTGYVARSLAPTAMARSQMFHRVPVRPNVMMPPWDIHEGDLRRGPVPNGASA